jgi:hypothetical protein
MAVMTLSRLEGNPQPTTLQATIDSLFNRVAHAEDDSACENDALLHTIYAID